MRTRLSGIRAMMAAIGAVALTFAAPVFAVEIIDDAVQIDDRAAQLVQTSNSLCWEMYRYHQQQPDYQQSYRLAKQIWSRAGELREALRAGPVETEVLMQQVAEMNGTLTQVEQTLSKWGNGDRSLVAPNSGPGQRTIVTQGTEVDLPFIGIRVGRPQLVVTDDGPPLLERRRLHPNSPGSKRGLERELAAVKVAMSYLMEDAGVTIQEDSPTPAASAATGPVPEPPAPEATLGDPQKIGPVTPKNPGGPSLPK